ncbi:MAG: hypothetical protein CME36_17520 [unclassified Hahellaceae]|nr:hypothetical protein [Hahellaceae bacterium]|tara:strand:- start:5722 stop:6120 length:399 start_codon:yes stop_codon:yes gene_type:complete
MLLAMQLSYLLLLIAVFADKWFAVNAVNTQLLNEQAAAEAINPWIIGFWTILPLLLFAWPVIAVKRKLLVGFCFVLCIYFATAIVDWLTYNQLIASAVALLAAAHFTAIGLYLKMSRPVVAAKPAAEKPAAI